MRHEREYDAGEEWRGDAPTLTRQALCAQAEALAVELVRWKVWRVEGHPHANLQEAQAMQALVMALVELLDDVHGSLTAVHIELTRAMTLLGSPWQARGTGAAPTALCATAEEHGEDAAFLRTHGLRLGEGTEVDDPCQTP